MLEKTKQLIETLRNCKGAQRVAVWVTPIRKLRGDFNGTHIVSKQVLARVRAGIDYANLGTVKDAIANGEREEVQPLPWGEWLQFPYAIGHTRKDGAYNEYVRFYPPVLKAGSEVKKPQVQWYLDGVPTTYASVEPMLLASDKPTEEVPACFNVNVENIVAVQDIGQ